MSGVSRILRFALALSIGAAVWVSAAGCKHDTVQTPKGMRPVQLSKVPVRIDVPAAWKKVRDDPTWLVFEDQSSGVSVAISGERDCTVVEKRLFSQLIGLGLNNVQWTEAPRESTSHGMRTTRARGTATKRDKKVRLAYVLARTPKRRGCMISLVLLPNETSDEKLDVVDKILSSVAPTD